MLNKRLIHWLESNSIIPNNFYGFRSGRSTTHAVGHLVTDIHKAFANKEHLIAAFLDIESAYSNVHLPTLNNILSQIGLPPHFAQYIKLMYINQQATTFYSNNSLSLAYDLQRTTSGFPPFAYSV